MQTIVIQKNWTDNIQTVAGSSFLDCGYNWHMDFEEKTQLARKDDMGLEACAIRLRAARATTGLAAKDLAAASGVSKTVYSNAENGSTYPNRDLMKHLYRQYRIDFNFLMNGDFVQLPGDVQEALFPALEAARNEWDRKQGSGPSRTTARVSQA